MRELMPEYFGALDGGRKAAPGLREAIAHFPPGRMMTILAQAVEATGPHVCLRKCVGWSPEGVARNLAACGRARQVLVISVEEREHEFAASAALICGDTLTTGDPAHSSAITGAALVGDRRLADFAMERDSGDGCSRFALASATQALAQASPAGRIAVVFASFLGSAPDVEFARARDGKAPSLTTLDDTFLALARRLNPEGPHVLIAGIAEASACALGVADDILRLGQADAVLVCGVETLGTGLDASLRLLECTDRPYFAEGAAALILEARAADRPCLRVLDHCELVSPLVRRHVETRVDLSQPRLKRLTEADCRLVIATGCTAHDLKAGSAVASQLWPDDPRREHRVQVSGRRLGAGTISTLVETLAEERCVGIVSVNGLGGSGILVSSPG